VSAPDLSAAEQTHVRTALRFLRARAGSWAPLARALRFQPRSIAYVANGHSVTPALAFRVARLAGVGVDDVLAGRFPPANACPHCGLCRDTA
jgi:plasmid maintenance system antidote protein VapI